MFYFRSTEKFYYQKYNFNNNLFEFESCGKRKSDFIIKSSEIINVYIQKRSDFDSQKYRKK